MDEIQMMTDHARRESVKRYASVQLEAKRRLLEGKQGGGVRYCLHLVTALNLRFVFALIPLSLISRAIRFFPQKKPLSLSSTVIWGLP